MYKLLIADDESRIRKGLRSCMDWNKFNIQIAGEAEDGKMALKLAKDICPEIILLDICMPFINGLEVITRLKDINQYCMIIIITGFDEFEYTHQALKLKVFDYILKPVNMDNLKNVILKAVQELSKIEKQRDYSEWTNRKLNENSSDLKQIFLNNWLNGELTAQKVINELEFFQIKLDGNIGMVVIKVIERFNLEVSTRSFDKKLLGFAIENIACELLGEVVLAFHDDNNNIVVICNADNIIGWGNIESEIIDKIYFYLHRMVLIEKEKIIANILDVKNVYKKMVVNINKKAKYKPIVILAIKYIDDNYNVNDFNIETVADKLKVSSSYISKLLKQEIGLGFVDYLTYVRIKKSIFLMEDPTIKIYEVAEMVGYSNQHYFCKIFKKIIGISPKEYQGGGL